MPKIEKLDEPGLYRLTFPPTEDDPEESVYDVYLELSPDPNFLKVYSERYAFIGIMPNPTILHKASG